VHFVTKVSLHFWNLRTKNEFFGTLVGLIQSQKFHRTYTSQNWHFWFFGILNFISARNGSKFRKTYFVK
jgi:hypothetical protein